MVELHMEPGGKGRSPSVARLFSWNQVIHTEKRPFVRKAFFATFYSCSSRCSVYLQDGVYYCTDRGLTILTASRSRAATRFSTLGCRFWASLELKMSKLSGPRVCVKYLFV